MVYLNLVIKFVKYSSFLLTLLPIIFTIFIIVNYHVDIPLGDQWVFVPTIKKAFDKSLTFEDLWAVHNEHRILFPKIVMIVLALSSNWNITYELVTNIILKSVTFIVLLANVKRTTRLFNPIHLYILIPIISLTFFSFAQWVNFLWGWANSIFLNVFTVTLGFYFLTNPQKKWHHYFLSVFCGIVAIYSFGSGIMYWIAGLVIIKLIRFREKNKLFFLWIVFSVSTIIIYLIGYKIPDDQPSITYVLGNPVAVFKYFFVYIGTPLTSYSSTLALICGIGGCLLAGFLIYVFLLNKVYTRILSNTPFFAFILYVVLSAALTAVARGGYSGLNSNYVTISLLFWISIIVFLFIDLKRLKFKPDRYLKYLRIILIEFITLMIIINSVIGIFFSVYWSDILSKVCSDIIALKNDTNLKVLSAEPDRITTGLVILKKYRLSLFRKDDSCN